MERTHHGKKETARPQNKGDKMANREKLTTLTRKQVTDIQNSNKTHMDLRHRTLGAAPANPIYQ